MSYSDNPDTTHTASPEYDLPICQCCGGSDLECVAAKRGYPIINCTSCGLLFVHPKPSEEELAGYYSSEEGYFATTESNLELVDPLRAIQLNDRAAQLAIQPGNFLDVGCASGHLLYQMKKLGWNVFGNDINTGALEIARNNGLEVHHGTLEDCRFPDNFFDLVNLGDILEHVPTPRNMLDEVYRIIKPGDGAAIIKLPNADCGMARYTLLLSRVTGFPWFHSEAPYHLTEFSPSTISRLLKDTRFVVSDICFPESTGFAYIVGTSGYFDKLKKQLKRGGKSSRTINWLKYSPLLFAVSMILIPFWVFGNIKDRIDGRGRNMLITATKQP